MLVRLTVRVRACVRACAHMSRRELDSGEDKNDDGSNASAGESVS